MIGFRIRNGLLATVVVLALAGIEPSSAAESRSSLYVSLDTGANFASGLDFQGGDNDRPPNLRRDGSEAVAYREKIDDLKMLGISIGLRYGLPW